MIGTRLKHKGFLTSLIFVTSTFVSSAEENTFDRLMNLSLDELLKVQMVMPGAITKGDVSESPASLTSISEADIAITPARNILDLIEIYVPGATWLNYEEGPLIGMRGSIVNGNYKYLLLLNGRVLNAKAMRGAQSELEQWNLSDILKIDIIRSPGSVTYGPGAVAGVINIHTKQASNFEGTHLQGRYISNYDSKGLSLNYGFKKKNYDMFSHFSSTYTKGYEADHFLGSDGAGYVGNDILPNDRPLHYFGDAQDKPQIKFHTDFNFEKGWRSWVRYTQQGSNWAGNEVKSDFGNGLVNQQSVQTRQITMALENVYSFSKDDQLKTVISLDTLDAERRRDAIRHSDPENVQNKKNNYSESEFLINSIYNYTPNNWAEVAFGLEYSYESFGPGWGDSPSQMKLGGDGQVISDLNSEALGPKLTPAKAIFIGKGWETHSYAILSESSFKVNKYLKLLLSGRLDKSTYSDHLFSPRLSALTKIDDKNSLRFILQRSFRRNTAVHEYLEHLQGKEVSKESLDSFETIYTKKLNKDLSFNAGAFFNDAEVIAWDSNADVTAPVGDLQTYGIELELDQRKETTHWGINYSYTKQLSFSLDPSLTSSGITYSDYNEPIGGEGAVINDKGNDLNNWPNQAFKVFYTKNFYKKWAFHLNTQAFWDFQGGKDGLAALENAVQGTSDEAATEAAIQRVKEEKTFGLNFRTNIAMTYLASKNSKFTFNIFNLFNSKYSKRYSYDSGTSKTDPHKVRFLKEERAFGLQDDHKW